MPIDPAVSAGDVFAFNIRGPAPRGPLAERLLRGGQPAGAAGLPAVLLIDGQSAGPEVVREVMTGGLDQPLLLLHAGPAMRAALGLPVAFLEQSDAYLMLPARKDEPLRIVDFSPPMNEPLLYTEESPSADGDAVFVRRQVRPGEIPPPEPFPPAGVPDRFANPNIETDALAASVRRQIEAYLSGEQGPSTQSQPDPPPAGVILHRYPTLSKCLTVHHADIFYGTQYVPEQVGTIVVSYFFTGYRNIDANGEVQSDVLVVELAVDAAPAGTGDILTRAEVEHHGFKADRYLGWFQESITAGLNYRMEDDLVLLGTTPNTVNRTVKETSTKGFSIDIGFKVSASGAKPTLGLTFKNEVTTTTQFNDWEVGEQTSLFKPDLFRNDQFVETVRWQYAVAHPYNGVVDGALLARTPPVAAFTPQSTTGFDFHAATALEIPAGSPASRAGTLALDAVLGWNLKYYYDGTAKLGPKSRECLGAHWLPVEQSHITIDLTPIGASSAL
jgi:hypothetical protein